MLEKCDIWAPVSDEPTPSEMTTFGMRSINRCLSAGLSDAPPLPKPNSELVSCSPRSSSSINGRAMASPTTVTVLTRSRATVSHTSAGSSVRTLSGSTSVPPPVMPMKPAHWAAPCISGGRSSMRRNPSGAFSAICS